MALRRCAVCGRNGGPQGLRACSRCRGEWYCGTECQRVGWTAHRPACVEISRRRGLQKPWPRSAAGVWECLPAPLGVADGAPGGGWVERQLDGVPQSIQAAIHPKGAPVRLVRTDTRGHGLAVMEPTAPGALLLIDRCVPCELSVVFPCPVHLRGLRLVVLSLPLTQCWDGR